MNARVAAVLVVLLAVLGGGALLMQQQDRARRPAAADLLGQPVVKDLQAADIAAIVIREPGATLTLQRRDARWTIAERAGFAADVEQVRQLVLAVLALKVGSSEPIGDKDRARLKLDGSGAQLEFRGADGKALATLVVGKKYFKREPENADRASGDGRFVLLPATSSTAYVVADPLALATAKSASWIDKTGFGAEKVRSMEVDHVGSGKWRIERTGDNAEWKLTPLYAGEKLDVIRANSASYSLNRVQIADVAAPSVRREDTGLDKPVTVVASTFDGLTYTLKLGKPRGEDYYATLWMSGVPKVTGADAAERAKQIAERLPHEKALAGQVLLIARSKFEDVLKKRSELLEKKDPGKK
ncbi:MAG: DUF4340 domain-containing protein [Betaproteobacteria bacterium]|nr:DUF4340 domain-containing protein [Betaproteobacteria bacterium]